MKISKARLARLGDLRNSPGACAGREMNCPFLSPFFPFSCQDLEEEPVIREFRNTAADGKSYETGFYDLDVIVAVGYLLLLIGACKGCTR